MREQTIGIATLGDIPIKRLMGLAEAADRGGLSSVWIADEPFFRGAMPAAAVCASATQHVRLGLGVVNPFDHPPVWMARDFATIQEIAAGRLILGIGASWRPPIEAQGIEWTKPLSAVADAVHIVRELLDGQTSTFAGKKFSTSGVALSFDPPPGRSMIHVGAMFPRSLEQAARIADGVILSILCPITYVRKVQQTIDEAVGLAGSPERFEVVQYLPMQMSEDGDTARDSVKRYIAFFIRHSYGSDPEHWRKVAELGEFDIAEFEHVYRRLTDGRRPEDAVDDSFLDRFGVAGTPSHCLDLLAEYRAAGTTEPVALFPPWANLERQVEMVASDLLPQWNLLL